MNKAMLGCLCLLLTSISAIAELTPKVILTLPDTDSSGGSYWNKALDVNNDLHCAMYFRSGSDLTVLIFSREKTEIVKEFTIKNILPSEEGKKRVELYGLDFQSIGGSDYNDICCSQKLFNNDDLWEIVIHEYEEDDNYNYIYNHFYVYNEKGNLLGDVDLFGIDVLELSPSNVCLIKRTFIDDSDLNEYKIVSFTDDSTGIKEISSEKKLTFAYPNPLPSGRDFIIELNSPSEDNMLLIVSDMNGRIVYHSKIKLAETKVRIPASCNLRGSYVFSIEKDGVIVEKGKILAH